MSSLGGWTVEIGSWHWQKSAADCADKRQQRQEVGTVQE
jgi:hypothetical protein